MGHQISRKLEKSKYGGENKNDLAFRDKKSIPERYPWSSYSKWTSVGKWTVEKLTFAKDPSKIHETSGLSYYRNDYYKAQQRSICDHYFLSLL